MKAISTHVLDLASGRPAQGVVVRLERAVGEDWHEVGRGTTDTDGRAAGLLAAERVEAAVYRLLFAVGAYFKASEEKTLYPEIVVLFRIDAAGEGLHLPLLLSPFGYSTYRGS